MKALKYIIKGQPLSYAKAHYAYESGYSNSKEAQLVWRVSLTSQHDDKPLLSESLEVFFDFYFANTLTSNQKRKYTPSTFELVRFVAEMATGIIWTDSRNIMKSTVEKYYSSEPRTEITIIRLGI